MRRWRTLVLAVALLGVGLVNAQPSVARVATVAGSETAHHAPVHAHSAETFAVARAMEYAAATPVKRKVKKETLWLMIGLLASMAIAGLVSAIRRAKNIRED